MVRVLLHGREFQLHQETDTDTEVEESEHDPVAATDTEAETEAVADLTLPVGAEAELRMDDPGFHGSFYEVTITAHLPSRRSYRVLYSTLVADDGGPLQETVAAAQVRPRPPPMSAGSGRQFFKLHQAVEAYHNEGWWPGIVSAVPPPPPRAQECRRPRVYEVAFPTSGDTREFQDTALRPHRVFHHGRWLPAAQLEFINATKLASRKRPSSSASSIYKEVAESSDKKCSYRGKKLKSVDVVSAEPTSPEPMMKQRNAVVALGSKLVPPSLLSMARFAHSSDPSLAQSSASSQNVITTSAPLPQSQQLQTSMVGTFGQPRLLLQGSLLGMQSLNPHTPKKGTSAKSIEETGSIVSMSEDCSLQGGGSGMDDRDSESLPFVKTFPLWAQLEGLEIFSRAPQRPHLNQLQQLNPLFREGVAFGLMFSFASLAESINRLDDVNGVGLLEEKKQALSKLEEYGFEVRALRSRLETLLCRKNSRGGAELRDDAMKALEEKIARDRELGVQIRLLTMAVQDLGIYERLMRDAMRSAVAQKLNNAVQIARLKAEAKELERSAAAAAV